MTEEGVAAGGRLLFGITPNRFLPHAGFDAVAYPGREKDYATRERTTLRGAMTPLLAADGSIQENGLVEQAFEFIRRNTSPTTQFKNKPAGPSARLIPPKSCGKPWSTR